MQKSQIGRFICNLCFLFTIIHVMHNTFGLSLAQVWLGRLADEMQSTLQALLVECTKAGKATSGGIDPARYPSQILCLAEQILFTERCEQAIQSGSLSEFLIELESQLESYINIDLVSAQVGLIAPVWENVPLCQYSAHWKTNLRVKRSLHYM